MEPELEPGEEPRQSECMTKRRSPSSILDLLGVLSICPRRAVGERQSRHSHTSEVEDVTDRSLSVPYMLAEQDRILSTCVPLAADGEGQAG
jgi:hypothetical protein